MNKGIIIAGIGLTLIFLSRNTGKGQFIMTTLSNDLIGFGTEEQKQNRTKYEPTIKAAEKKYGLPDNLLLRLINRESRFLTKYITGAVKSSVGAIGIAQFMPATASEWKVDPYNPISSIDGAARYLAWLHKQLGSWQKAVGAYNWGIGNVKKAISKHGDNWLTNAVSETKVYVKEIMG